jgi:hypothetical protein
LTLNSEPSAERRAGLAAVAGFAVLTLYFTGLFPPFGNPNELSRLEMVFAFVEQGTFRIDGAIPVLGDHEDKAVSGSHFYSNKAPGLAFAAIPVYRVLRVFFPPPRSASDAVFVLLRILTVSFLCVVALARFALRLAGGKGSALLVFALAFGTPLLFYGRSFFGHAWTAALLFLAWDLARKREERGPAGGARLLAAGAGLLCGWAAISEYTAAPLAMLLALRVAARGSWRTLALFAAGAAVPLLLLLSYDASCFGSPWVLSSAREAHRSYSELAGKGLFGFGAPSPRIAWDLLFHPARGLLLFSPFLVFAIPGFLAWWRSGEDRADCVFALAAVLGFFLLLTAYPNWHGGWSLGDRYLLPVLLFAGLAAARGFGGPQGLPLRLLGHTPGVLALASPLSRSLFAAAAIFSATAHFLLTASWPHFPLDVAWPPATGSLWFLQHGWIAGNLLASLHWASLLPPAALTVAAGSLALRAARPFSVRAFIAVPAGLLLLAATLLCPPALSYGARLWRAAIYGAYSGLDPARGELRSVALSASTPLERRQAQGAWRLYGR